MPISFASMFSCGGQADLAARSLGMELVGAIEHDAPIAAVYADNFGSRHLTIGDVADFDFRQWKGLDHLHASNSCKPHAFGRANGDPKDHAQYASAYEICRALKVIQPQTFTLENSPNFARSEPYRAIMGVLLGLGYGIFAGNLNASDFGVPQDRRRRIVIALKGGGLVSLRKHPWIGGWGTAVGDLVEALPPCQPAAYQMATLDRLGSKGAWLIQRVGTAYRNGQPCPTVRHSSQHSFTVRAFGRGCDGHGPDQANIWLADRGEMRWITPRIYARLMGVPDGYRLPSDPVLAVEVLGNGFPPPFAASVFGAALGAIGWRQEVAA